MFYAAKGIVKLKKNFFTIVLMISINLYLTYKFY